MPDWKLNDMPLDWNALLNDEKVMAMFGYSDPAGKFSGHAVFGVYVLLLHGAWVSDLPASLPNNDAILAGLARVEVSLWQKIKPVVMTPFALCGDGRWHQKKMRQVYERVISKLKAKSEAGKIGMEKRWGNKGKHNSVITALSERYNNRSRIEEEDKKRRERESRAPDDRSYEPIPKALDTPEFREQWESWKAHLVEKHKPMSLQTENQQLRNLLGMGHDRGVEALKYTIGGGWTSICEPEKKQSKHYGKHESKAIQEEIKVKRL